jgi:hypothetical protein
MHWVLNGGSTELTIEAENGASISRHHFQIYVHILHSGMKTMVKINSRGYSGKSRRKCKAGGFSLAHLPNQKARVNFGNGSDRFWQYGCLEHDCT